MWLHPELNKNNAMVDIPLPPFFVAQPLHLTVNIKWCSTFLQLCLINSYSTAPIFWHPPPPQHQTPPPPHQGLNGLLTWQDCQQEDIIGEWDESTLSHLIEDAVFSQVPFHFAILLTTCRKKENSLRLQFSWKKKFNDWDDESIQFKIISKWIQKMIFFSSVLLSSNSKTF